jgi:glutamate racemase
MKIRVLSIMLITLGFFIVTGCRNNEKKQNDYLLRQKTIKIVVTDSGLGGLSVMEDLMHKIRESGYYTEAEIIFVNALFDSQSGYNALNSRNDKIIRFNTVLDAIESRYAPDAIVVACNTLSVLIDETEFIKKSGTPVIGIVEPGVSLIKAKIEDDPSATIIIFGTETTIEEESHIKALRNNKIPEKRIVSQACPQLQSYIEEDPYGEETAMLIDFYTQEALAKLADDSHTVYISLNCSHYGYSTNFWVEAMNNAPWKFGGIINPNSSMADILIVRSDRTDSEKVAELKFSVVSKVELGNTVALQNYFFHNAPEISGALKGYFLLPDLF